MNVTADVPPFSYAVRDDEGGMGTGPIRIGLIGYDGITGLDLTGPMEAFSSAYIVGPSGFAEACYEIVVIGVTGHPFTSNSGLVMMPATHLAAVPDLDTLIIPGGAGLREPETNRAIVEALAELAGRVRRVVSICTGIYGLAPTGLLDGRRVTTHWSHARDVARRFPKLRVDANALFIKDGRFYSSAGITAGIDLSLALIEEDFGQAVSLAVARALVVYLKRPGGQDQYSEPLRLQIEAVDRFGDLAVWIAGHLGHDLSVTALADRVNLSPRQFNRRFKATFGVTPADYVEDMRLNEARRQLLETDRTVETIAHAIGFASDDVARRAFERRFGIAPSLYRHRFTASKTILESVS
jgi:transcriptional regulator GlxA family with amidase domain